jgi:hypothetical protein
MEMTQGEMLEFAGVVLTILFGGIVVAILVARTSVSRKEARHRKISASRRAQNTSYDLFTAREKPAAGTRSGSRRRRRRKSQSSHFMIDILRHDEGEGEDGKTPARNPETEGGST